MLCRWLRSHQREGVQFLFDCVTDVRKYGGCGCILADDSAPPPPPPPPRT
jgi:DNA repair and recombination RAD54-like protein